MMVRPSQIRHVNTSRKTTKPSSLPSTADNDVEEMRAFLREKGLEAERKYGPLPGTMEVSEKPWRGLPKKPPPTV